MVNIPSNLQSVWNEVAKDGKIDKADYKKLLTAAAPSIAKGDEVGASNELDEAENAFLSNFESLKDEKVSSLAVKNGNATGTFEFVDEVKFPTKDKSSEKTETKPTTSYYQPVSLDGGKTTANPETTKTDKAPVTTNETQTTSAPDPKDAADLKSLKDLKASLQKLKGPEIEQQIKDVDQKISALEQKIAKAQTPNPAPTPDKTEDTPHTEEKPAPAPTENKTPEVAPATNSKTKENLATLENYKKLKEGLPKAGFKGDELAQKIAFMDKKIADITVKIQNDFIADAGSLKSKVGTPDFDKAKATLQADYNSLPEDIKNKPEVQAAYKAATETPNLTPKQKLFGQINEIINATVNEALKTGDMSKFTVAKLEIEKLVAANPELANDPEIAKIKAILTGAAPARGESNAVYKAIDTIQGTKTLLNKPDWSKADYTKAQTYIQDKDFVDGPFKQSLVSKAQSYEATKAKDKVADQKTAVKGIEDVIGKGFLNAANKEGTAAIFQSLSAKGELDDTLKRLKADDQMRVMKLLAESNDEFNLAIAKKIYNNLSSISNVDDDLKPALRDKIKNFNPKETEVKEGDKTTKKLDYDINTPERKETFAKGLKYSLYNEKEAALTMTRNIIDGTVSSDVLTKFSKEELEMMTKLVGNKGHKGEKQELLDIISGTYAKGDKVDVDYLKREDKAQVIKGLLDNEHIDESQLDELIKKSGKKVVFEVVNKNELTDKQLVVLARHSNGDEMADEPKVGAKMLLAMIRSYNKDQTSVSYSDISKFVDQIDKDWTEDDDVMKIVLRELGDGPDSEYAKFQALAPSVLDRIRHIAE